MDGLVKLLLNKKVSAAMIVNDVEPILVGGAVPTKVSLVDELEKDLIETSAPTTWLRSTQTKV